MTSYELQGKVALVTGGASGIGRGAALAFAEAGARVAIADIDTQGGAETLQLIHDSGGEALFLPVNVSQAEAVAGMVTQTVNTLGRLDFALNNAGIFRDDDTVTDLRAAAWAQTIAVNLTGVWLCMKYEILHMLENGGCIINMTSVLGLRGAARAAAYTASKHGVIGLTKSAAIAYAGQNIRVNAIAPGIIATPMEQPLIDDSEKLNDLLALYPMRRVGTVAEVAGLIVWLCSPAAGYITGAVLPVDGGHMAF